MSEALAGGVDGGDEPKTVDTGLDDETPCLSAGRNVDDSEKEWCEERELMAAESRAGTGCHEASAKT